MKKLILITILLPLLSFSQILVKDVSSMTFMTESPKFHKNTDVLDMTIYIESEYLVIKSNTETTKYKIIKSTHRVNDETLYEVIIDKKTHYVNIFHYQKSEGLIIINENNNETTIFYERKKVAI